MDLAEYIRYDGLGLAELVRNRNVSAGELLEVAIRAVDVVNSDINAVIEPMYDQARDAAERITARIRQGSMPAADAPFAGVPFLLKDLQAAYAGVPLRMGCRGLHDFIPQRHSELVQRFLGSGLVVLGKTNTPEFGLTFITEPLSFGPTRNPWDPQRNSGGSSGGSAAAVAAGIVPLAHGNDGGGSIRIPASACGVFGLKPSRGRQPVGPEVGELWSGMASEHVLSRSVRDSATALDVTAGPDIGASRHAPPPLRPFAQALTTDPPPLRIAYTRQSLHGNTVARECVEAVERTAKLLADLGHEVEEATPAFDRDEFIYHYLIVIFANVASDLDALSAVCGRPLLDRVEPITRSMALVGQATPSSAYLASMRYVHRLTRSVAHFFERWPLFISPTLTKAPVKLHALDGNIAEQWLVRAAGRLRARFALKQKRLILHVAQNLFDFAGSTTLFNATGQPAMSVPMHWSEDGLPIGVQVAARYGDEATLFALAGQLERAQPWIERRPQISVA